MSSLGWGPTIGFFGVSGWSSVWMAVMASSCWTGDPSLHRSPGSCSARATSPKPTAMVMGMATDMKRDSTAPPRRGYDQGHIHAGSGIRRARCGDNIRIDHLLPNNTCTSCYLRTLQYTNYSGDGTVPYSCRLWSLFHMCCLTGCPVSSKETLLHSPLVQKLCHRLPRDCAQVVDSSVAKYMCIYLCGHGPEHIDRAAAEESLAPGLSRFRHIRRKYSHNLVLLQQMPACALEYARVEYRK